MSIDELRRLIKGEPLSHRPPLPRRYWFYSAAAYLLPVVIQIAAPNDPALNDELVWLVTLVPAFVLALHYGFVGAFAALVLGAGLFTAVQVVVRLNFTPDDWRITVPTVVAYVGITISVGALSEKLHVYYQQALRSQRLATIGQMALTLKHEVNNALTAIMAESELLAAEAPTLLDHQRESVRNLSDAVARMAGDIDQLTKLEDAPVMTHLGELELLDLREATTREA
jgi:signal transduction histidine kinase